MSQRSYSYHVYQPLARTRTGRFIDLDKGREKDRHKDAETFRAPSPDEQVTRKRRVSESAVGNKAGGEGFGEVSSQLFAATHQAILQEQAQRAAKVVAPRPGPNQRFVYAKFNVNGTKERGRRNSLSHTPVSPPATLASTQTTPPAPRVAQFSPRTLAPAHVTHFPTSLPTATTPEGGPTGMSHGMQGASGPVKTESGMVGAYDGNYAALMGSLWPHSYDGMTLMATASAGATMDMTLPPLLPPFSMQTAFTFPFTQPYAQHTDTTSTTAPLSMASDMLTVSGEDTDTNNSTPATMSTPTSPPIPSASSATVPIPPKTVLSDENDPFLYLNLAGERGLAENQPEWNMDDVVVMEKNGDDSPGLVFELSGDGESGYDDWAFSAVAAPTHDHALDMQI